MYIDKVDARDIPQHSVSYFPYPPLSWHTAAALVLDRVATPASVISPSL